MADQTIKLLRHQQQFIQLPFQYPDLEAVFLIGGYSCGKSFSLVAFVLDISRRYNGHHIVCGLGSPTITFFKKTILIDLERTLITAGIKYRFNGQDNSITIGTVKWYIIPMEAPKDVYGYNFCTFAFDEGDELAQDRFIEAFLAVQERVRIEFPDGRKPFSVFASTAQGLKGIYRVTENLKEKGVPFAIIRGRTQDNTNLPAEYYNRLYALYTDNERRAFLFGEFVNLTAGRVYPQFDPSTCVVDDFPLDDNEEVILGQDLNLNASCATGFIVRDGIMYACREYTFKDFSQAAVEIARSLPTQRKIMWPDASGTFIISGYAADMMQNGIEVRRMPKNPSIEERIMLINKLFATGKLKVFKSLKQSTMAWLTRCFDDNGKPAKATKHPEPSDYNDSSEYASYQIASTRPEFFELFTIVSKHGRG